MTSYVIDNSAAVALASHGFEIMPDLEVGVLYAPELIDLEFANVLRKLVLRGELDAGQAGSFLAEWASNELVRCPHAALLPRVWQLRANITTYDAAYVALAEHLQIPLVTADHKLARAAEAHCDVIAIGG